ncbi:hypothetical protein L596_024387 [Steinernema carpocapsae]|uniref:Uncharacterized protein n=1 Tax=Steinernema carpocapsae TaxID=34508 RepID=A0A4U5MGL1_STECR|nr:hypothetical protein L596_024387 [Steinernema carpocapsae]
MAGLIDEKNEDSKGVQNSVITNYHRHPRYLGSGDLKDDITILEIECPPFNSEPFCSHGKEVLNLQPFTKVCRNSALRSRVVR